MTVVTPPVSLFVQAGLFVCVFFPPSRYGQSALRGYFEETRRFDPFEVVMLGIEQAKVRQPRRDFFVGVFAQKPCAHDALSEEFTKVRTSLKPPPLPQGDTFNAFVVCR